MIRVFVAISIIATILTGCATDRAGEGRVWLPVTEPKTSDLDLVLGFYDRVARLKGQELAREFDSAKAAFDREQSEVNRMQLAMLLSLPQASFRDDAMALGLVQVWSRDKSLGQSGLRPLALLMQTMLAESRRNDETIQTQSTKLRDEQRRAEALQQKLEALLEMEMKMIEREQAAQPRRR